MVWYHDGMITDSTTVQKEFLNEIENLNKEMNLSIF